MFSIRIDQFKNLHKSRMIDGAMEINCSLLKNTRLALSVVYKENILLDDFILIRVIHSY